MLSIKEATSKPKVTANLLPCRIHHDGPIDPATPYWKPQEAEGMRPIFILLTSCIFVLILVI